MPNNYKFAVFILTHGRPHDVHTYGAMRDAGYTGDIYLIIDNEDKKADEYRNKYGHDKVIVFDKAAIGKTFDICDTRTDRRATVFARNASFDIAEQLGLDYYMQMDDDYNGFRYRFHRDEHHVGSIQIKSLDQVIEAMITFLDQSNAASVAMSQGGDFLGGIESQAARKPLLRKCMNSWLFRTDRRTQFVGRMNDDVNTYIMGGIRGELFFTCSAVMLNALPTQQIKGGMTEIYLDSGTYMKSMYTVMMAPSCVSVRAMGKTNRRLHHHVKWDSAVPKILSDKHRKKR